VQFSHREINSSFRDTVRHHRHRCVFFQLAIRTHGRGDGEKFGVARLLEEGLRGAEEEDRAQSVDYKGVEVFILRGRGRGAVAAEDTRVGDDDVEMGDVVLGLEGGDGRLGQLRVEAS
jgi:hypothetical protein